MTHFVTDITIGIISVHFAFTMNALYANCELYVKDFVQRALVSASRM